MDSLHPMSASKITYLLGLQINWSSGNSVQLPAAWSASHPNDGGDMGAGRRALQSLPQGCKLGLSIAVKGEVGRWGVVSSTHHTLRGQQAGHGDTDSRERLPARLYGTAVAGGGPRGIRGV